MARRNREKERKVGWKEVHRITWANEDGDLYSCDFATESKANAWERWLKETRRDVIMRGVVQVWDIPR